MKRFNQFVLTSLTLSTLFFTSCNSDDGGHMPGIDETGEFAKGVFILNEGNFGAGNASVSFLSEQGVLQNNIFQAVNGELLGDTAQSIYLDEDKAYIVLNGSGIIEVVNRYTFERIGTVSTGLSNPRYFVIENGKGFVSNSGDPTNTEDDYIAVINLTNYTVSTTIPVSEGPEKMETDNGKIYVAHSGGWGYGNTVSVINSVENTVSATLNVGDIPNSLTEKNGKLYVLCSGKAAWTGEETEGGLFVISTSDNSVQNSFYFPVGQHPSQLVEDNGKLYYGVDAHVYSVNLGLASLPTTPLFTVADQGVYGIYGFAVEDDKIYVADAGDYASNGKVWVYSTSGSLQNEYTVGFLPNGFGFND